MYGKECISLFFLYCINYFCRYGKCTKDIPLQNGTFQKGQSFGITKNEKPTSVHIIVRFAHAKPTRSIMKTLYKLKSF